MANPYLASIMIFAGNFAPQGFAFCNGQTLPISQNMALFSLLGTSYGGDGIRTFQLPNLQGRVPIHAGNNGTSSYVIGQTGGSETVTLTQLQLPAHSHLVNCSSSDSTVKSPKNAFPAVTTSKSYSHKEDAQMSAAMVGNTGSGQPFGIIQPYLCLNYVIALVGIFPSRN